MFVVRAVNRGRVVSCARRGSLPKYGLVPNVVCAANTRYFSSTPVLAQQASRYSKLVDDTKLKINEVNIEEVNKRLEKGDKFYLVDVREQHEWDAGRLPNSIHLSRGVLERQIETQVPEVDADIVLYCAGGARSALAANNLQQMGYRKVSSMAGGFGQWKKAGFKVVQ